MGEAGIVPTETAASRGRCEDPALQQSQTQGEDDP